MYKTILSKTSFSTLTRGADNFFECFHEFLASVCKIRYTEKRLISSSYVPACMFQFFLMHPTGQTSLI